MARLLSDRRHNSTAIRFEFCSGSRVSIIPVKSDFEIKIKVQLCNPRWHFQQIFCCVVSFCVFCFFVSFNTTRHEVAILTVVSCVCSSSPVVSTIGCFPLSSGREAR